MKVVLAALAAWSRLCSTRGIEVRVATMAGNRYLDKRTDVEVDEHGSVGDLKSRIEDVFPGKPPAALQRLFFGSQLLADDSQPITEAVGDEGGRLELLLDMVPPIATTGRVPDETVERIRAFVAETVALEHTWRLLREGDPQQSEMRCEQLQAELAATEHALLDETLAQEIQQREALVAVGAMRTGLDDATPLAEWKQRLAVLLNVNWRDTLKLVIALVAAAKFGVDDMFRRNLFLGFVPVVLFAQTRHARFLTKLIWYALPTIHEKSFISAFFGAPHQILLSLKSSDYQNLLYLPTKADPKPRPNTFKTHFFVVSRRATQQHTDLSADGSTLPYVFDNIQPSSFNDDDVDVVEDHAGLDDREDGDEEINGEEDEGTDDDEDEVEADEEDDDTEDEDEEEDDDEEDGE